MTFPDDFQGCATASYQIEGGGLEDGRASNLVSLHTPGKIKNGDRRWAATTTGTGVTCAMREPGLPPTAFPSPGRG
jgi:beta-glucosidase/6-phospho-beta-glucosidase/beta-galactosidase